MEQSDLVTATELTRRINESHARLHDVLVQKLGGQFMRSSATESTVAGTATLDLDSVGNIYKLEGIERLVPGTSDRYEDLQRIDFRERNRFTSEGVPYYYALEDWREATQRLRLFPTPNAVYTIRVWYVPLANTLVDDSDAVVLPQNWHAWIAIDVAIQLRVKEETDVRQLLLERDRIERAIDTLSSELDHAEPLRVREVRDPWAQRQIRLGVFDDLGDYW